MAEDNSAAAQFRAYAGIEEQHTDVENKSKKGGPIDVAERERTAVDGTVVDPVNDEEATQKAQTDTVEAPERESARRASSEKGSKRATTKPAKKAASKSTVKKS